MCDSVVSEDPFLIVYCPDKYKTQRMCDEAVDDFLTALKLIPDWFVTNKMLEKFDKALLGVITLTNTKHLKKDLMPIVLTPIAWHPNRRWDFACQKMRKKKYNQFSNFY